MRLWLDGAFSTPNMYRCQAKAIALSGFSKVSSAACPSKIGQDDESYSSIASGQSTSLVSSCNIKDLFPVRRVPWEPEEVHASG